MERNNINTFVTACHSHCCVADSFIHVDIDRGSDSRLGDRHYDNGLGLVIRLMQQSLSQMCRNIRNEKIPINPYQY